MHQRPSPRSAAAASNPATNPERTNNPRERQPHRSRSSVDLSSYTERAGAGRATDQPRPETVLSDEDRENTRLNQIIQHFHTKAALLICSSRANLPQVYSKTGDVRKNRWFNIILDETDIINDALEPWRRPDLFEKRPSSLIVEVYLDTTHLSQNQTLVLMDENGQRHDVAASLASSSNSNSRPSRGSGRFCEVILERWTVELGSADDYTAAELQDLLPNVYKKGVVLFRSLYTIARFLPAWKLHRKLARHPATHQALRLRFRIRHGHDSDRGSRDTLYSPLCASEQGSVVERHQMPPVLSPAGPLCIWVDYRTNCDFSVADSEALLSSRFLGQDEAAPTIPVGRSLPGARSEQSKIQHGSLGAPFNDTRSTRGAYGSLGAFHAAGNRASPVTELRQRDLEQGDNDDLDRPGSAKYQEVPSRPSTSFTHNPPFKAGSLASSPRPSPSPTMSVGRPDSVSSRIPASAPSKRVSLNTLPQQSLRAPNETAIASSGSSSPKPAPVHRYSSSFANRNKRFTSQGSRTGESNVSSGRGSSSSKEKSGQLNEGSAGSAKMEEDDIASFISQIESAKDLPSFRARPASRDNTVNLGKYSNLRDPGGTLADEMSSSSLIQASVTPPSRRMSNVPGLSTSSSPSRILTHAPHVRSRLSTHSIAEEVTNASRLSVEESDSPRIREEQEDDMDGEEPFIFPLPHDSV